MFVGLYIGVCVVLKMSYNDPGLEAVLRLGEVKDNDGAQQNKLFP